MRADRRSGARAPLVALAVCLGLGALAGEDLGPRDALRLLGGAMGILVLALLTGCRRWGTVALAAASLGLGAAAAAVEAGAYRRAGLIELMRDEGAEGRAVRLEGSAAGAAQPSGDRESFLLDVRHATLAGKRRPLSGRVRVLVGGRVGVVRVAEGDAVAVWAVLRSARRYGTPGSFDAVDYARREGIHAVGFCKSPLLLEVRPTGGRGPGPVARARRWARETLQAIVPAGPEQGIVRAMVLGDRAGIDRETAEAFRIAGTYHVLALSGAQVALIAGGLLLMLRKLPGTPLLSALACSAAVAAYALFVGAETPVVRAAWMAVVLLLGRGLDLEGDALNLLGLAALLLLVQHPGAVRDAGFQLSFAATAGIVALAPPLVGRRDGRLVALRWALAGSVAAQAALLPILATQFHRAAPAALVLNLVAGPLASGVLLAGFAVLLVAPLGLALASPLGELAWALAHLLLESGRVVEGVSALDVRLPSPPGWALGVYVVGLVLVASPARRRRGLMLAALGAAGILMGRAGPVADGRLRVISLDVGQGDAHVLISPSGRVLLVDAGFAGERFDVGESVVAPFLWQSGIGLIDALALTHAHPDHLGGAPFLLRSFRVSETWESVAAYREAAYRAVERAAAGRGVRRLSLRRGFSRDWDGVQIDVLGPAPRGRSSGRARNDDSLVLGLRFKGVRVLLTGDIEAAAERELPRFRAQILKVAHHGSRSSSSEAFLAEVAPRIGVISVGSGTPFLHPHPEALARLSRGRVRLWRTDRDGTVTVSTDGTRVWLRSWAEGVERRIH